jgi:alpha-1,2-mannosyltransferase
MSSEKKPSTQTGAPTWLLERLITHPRVLLLFYLISLVAVLISARWSPNGLIDFMGYPLGRDFSFYWVASLLTVAGSPDTVYNLPQFAAAQQAYFNFNSGWYYAFFYPPTFLLLTYPLALLPYLLSLAVWLGITLGGYLEVLRRIAPHRRTIWLAITFTGTYVNIIFAQNGFLSAALIGGGLLLLDRYPLLGGALLGLVSYKPHLFPLILLALIAGRRWQTLLAAMIVTLALLVVSYLVFGEKVWLAFIHSMTTPVKMLHDHLVPIDKMTTIFSSALCYGAGPRLAWALQGSVSLGIAALVSLIWYREMPFPLRSAALVLGILLATPYAFPYDLAILALPLAWLAWEGYTHGWSPGEPELLFIGWLTPLLAMTFNFIGLHFFTPAMLWVLFFLVWRRSCSRGGRTQVQPEP